MRSNLTKSLIIMTISCPLYANYAALVGNVVARDLDVPAGGWAGHTGLASADHYLMRPTIVLEAMNSIPHIRQTNIGDFKNSSPYWGSRGGLLKPGSFDQFTVANRVVRQYFACPDYSYSWVWKAGTIDGNSRPLTCALFRCDTLMNHAYEFGTHHLPTYDTRWTTPAGVWNSFFLDTDLFVPERYVERQSSISLTNNTIDSITENNLKELNSILFYQLLQNSEDITNDQITRLWNLFESKEMDNQVKIIFYNFLSTQEVSHLTEEVINRAKNESGNVRHQLLLILQSIYQNGVNDTNKSNLEAITAYFNELQDENLNKDDAGIVYRGVATLSPKNIRSEKQNLINMDKIHVDLFSLKADRDNELNYVNDIIDNLDHPDDSLLVTATYKYLTELLINSDLKLFSDEGKELFKRHLTRHKMTETGQSMIYTSAFIEFKAALNAKNKDEIPALTIKYMKSLNSDMQQTTPYGFSDFTQKKLNIHTN